MKFRIWLKSNHVDLIYFENFSMVFKFLKEPSDWAYLVLLSQDNSMGLKKPSPWPKSPPQSMAKSDWVTLTFRSDFTTMGFDLIANCGIGFLIAHNTNLRCKMLANCERPPSNGRIQIILIPILGLYVWIVGFNRRGNACISVGNAHLSFIMHGNRSILQINIWNILDSCLDHRYLKFTVPL